MNTFPTNGRGFPKGRVGICACLVCMHMWVCVFMQNSVEGPGLNMLEIKGWTRLSHPFLNEGVNGLLFLADFFMASGSGECRMP